MEKAYSAFSRPALGRSDHNVIHLIPKYKQLLKTEKPRVDTISVWSYNSMEGLKACFECTDWDVFFEANQDANELTDTITSYIQWCKAMYIENKSVMIFPNNKPWISKELKHVLNEKKHAFLSKDDTKTKKLNKTFRSKLRQAKLAYKDNVERKLIYDAWSAWQGLNTMMGRKTRQDKPSSPADPLTFANELNVFYARFELLILVMLVLIYVKHLIWILYL